MTGAALVFACFLAGSVTATGVMWATDRVRTWREQRRTQWLYTQINRLAHALAADNQVLANQVADQIEAAGYRVVVTEGGDAA